MKAKSRNPMGREGKGSHVSRVLLWARLSEQTQPSIRRTTPGSGGTYFYSPFTKEETGSAMNLPVSQIIHGEPEFEFRFIWLKLVFLLKVILLENKTVTENHTLEMHS